jgi:hypothetical protein
VGGYDAIEGCGHGLHHFKEVERVIPKAYYVQERMEQIQMQYETNIGERITDPNRLIQVQITQASRYDRAHPAAGGSFNIPRAGSSMHRRPNRQRAGGLR